MSRTAFIAFGSSCISKVVPLDGTDSWDVFRWHYGGWRWHDNVGDGTVEYIRTNATEIAAPMSEPTESEMGEFEKTILAGQPLPDADWVDVDEATESKGDE